MFGDTDIKLDYADVLLVPRESELSSRSQIKLTIDHFDEPMIPIIAANMDGVGTFAMARELAKYKMMTALVKHYSLDELVEFYGTEESKYAIYSMGISEDDFDKLVNFSTILSDAGISNPPAICVDVANGYTTSLLKFIERIREAHPEYVLMVGNVVTPERTEKLIECGADIVKIGVGPGSVCTTRKITGIGYPQFSAVIECAAAADSAGGAICADGGITCPGDAVKAFAGGAHYVMIGGLFAGHDEGIGGTIGGLSEVTPSIPFYGMASKEAQNKHNGGVADYRASEGKFVTVPYRGPIDGTVQELLGGIRSACTYVGAGTIEDLHRRARFVRVNRQLNNMFT